MLRENRKHTKSASSHPSAGAIRREKNKFHIAFRSVQFSECFFGGKTIRIECAYRKTRPITIRWELSLIKCVVLLAMKVQTLCFRSILFEWCKSVMIYAQFMRVSYPVCVLANYSSLVNKLQNIIQSNRNRYFMCEE